MHTPLFRRLVPTLAALTAALLPMPAFAQAFLVTDLLYQVMYNLYPLAFMVGVLATVVIGLTLVSSSDESQLSKAKGALIALISGGVLIRLVPTIMGIFYSQVLLHDIDPGSVNAVNTELIGIATWFEMFAVTIAVFVVIIAGFRAIASFGSEAANTAVRRSVLHAIAGILVLVFIGVIRTVLFNDRTPNGLIAEVFLRVTMVLGLIAVVMVGVIIFAGVLMVISAANEGNVDRAKGIIFRAIIGLIVVLFSVALVQIVVGVFA